MKTKPQQQKRGKGWNDGGVELWMGGQWEQKMNFK